MSQENGTQWADEPQTQPTMDNVDAKQAMRQAQAKAQQPQQPQMQNQHQAHTPNQGQQYRQQQQTNKIPNLISMLSSLETQVNLSEEGRKYQDTLRKALEDRSWNFDIKCVRLTDPAEAFFYYSDIHEIGIVIVYTETQMHSEDEESITKLYGRARINASSFNPGKKYRVINVIGIGREDYGKVDAMITDMKNTFISDTSPQFNGLSINDVKNLSISINRNINAVKNFISAVSPHGVPAAMDYGFTIDIMVPRTDTMYFVVGPNQKREYETKTIAAITAKTNFLCNAPGGIPGFNMMGGFGMGGMQGIFLPVITITDIVSVIKSQYLLPLFLSIAHQVFIGTGLWKMPFRMFGAPKAVNVGNLLENQQTHQLLEMNSDQDVEGFLAAYCKYPIMALGITEGRSRVMGMEWLADHNLADIAIREFNSFLTKDQNNSGIIDDPVILRYAEYTGPATYAGELVDSRHIDYLRVVADNPNDAPNVRNLMMLQSDPADRARLIRNIAPDYKTKYITMNCALKHEALMLMGNQVTQHIRCNMDAQQGGPNYIGLDALLNESAQYSTGGFNMMGGGGAGGYRYTPYFGYGQGQQY